MDKYAVIKLGASQYIVEEGKEYEVPKFNTALGKVVVTDVLAIGEKDEVKLGNPNLDKAKVEIEVIELAKGEKVVSRTFRAKSRYRKTKGFRKEVIKFKVNKISY